jgi:hypothetical protein
VVTGRAPLLLVPGTTPLITPLDRVAVAWDGSTRRPRRCVPRCRCCKGRPVAVLTVGEKAASFPALDAVQYLAP